MHAETLVGDTVGRVTADAPLAAGRDRRRAGDAASDQPVWSDPAQRDRHVAVFLAWLPEVLAEAPDLAWDRLPSRVMGYLLNNCPPADWRTIPLTLAAGCATEGMGEASLRGVVGLVKNLLDELGGSFGASALPHLAKRQVWDAYTRDRALAAHQVRGLENYALLSAYVQDYLANLDDEEQAVWAAYLLPPLPARYLERLGLGSALQAAMQQRRKAEADVLVPLHPFLVNLALFRKQAAEKIHREFVTVRALAKAGSIALPYEFSIRTTNPVLLTPHPEALSDLKVRLEEVDLPVTLWDRRSWTRLRGERGDPAATRPPGGQGRQPSDTPDTYYLEFRCPAADILWFGDLIAHALVRQLQRTHVAAEVKAAAVRLGFPCGVSTYRGGLLGPNKSDAGFLARATRPGELLVDWDSLYRGILYGAALAVVFLTSGARLGEVQQISMSRWRIQEVQEIRGGQRTGRRVPIYLQHLLPKGSKTERERQLFLISPAAMGLLKEIAEGLAPTPQGIPVIRPVENTKAEHLVPEPYLFQWQTRPGRTTGLLRATEIGTLLRFLYHGVSLTTAGGRAITITPHKLRHAVAASARHRHNVPAEAVAWLLHHRQPRSSPPEARVGAATLYYSQAPAGDTVALLQAFQTDLVLEGAEIVLPPIEPHELEHLSEDIRDTIAQWGTIGLTAFGLCKAGMCVRKEDRALCIGCPFLVVHHSKLGNAYRWRRILVADIQRLEEDGNDAEARQRQAKITTLDGYINMMLMQRQVLADRGALPEYLMLSTPDDVGTTEGADHHGR